jgi:hypothetical protein
VALRGARFFNALADLSGVGAFSVLETAVVVVVAGGAVAVLGAVFGGAGRGAFFFSGLAGLLGFSGLDVSWILLVATGLVDVGRSVVTPFVLRASCGGAGRGAFFLDALAGLLDAWTAGAAWLLLTGEVPGIRVAVLISLVLDSVFEEAGRGPCFFGAFLDLLAFSVVA